MVYDALLFVLPGNSNLSRNKSDSRLFALFRTKAFKEWFSALTEPLLQFPGAIAIAAGPRLGPVFMAAIPPRVSILHIQQLEIFLPVRPFFRQRRCAIAGFHPMRRPILSHARLLHVINIFIPPDRSTTQRPLFNRI